MGKFPEIEPTGSHLTYLILSFFLLIYACFAEFIRNRIHLAEPPLATLTGILFGPEALNVFGPSKLGFEDLVTQELARVITGVQVFAVGIDLPAGYVKKHWKGIALLLGPNMIYGWFASAAIISLVLQVKWTTALIISACLTPTDPVLSASVLGEAKFSQRVPKRLRHILSAESGCNDGTSFPFLYAVIFAVTKSTAAESVSSFFLDTIFWQCFMGIVIGVTIGFVANKALRFSEERNYTQEATLFVFYFLLALFSIGVASTLGLDDFLVAFSAGTAFSWDGWFSTKTHEMKLPAIIDLLLNSTMFVYFGTIIPWTAYYDNLSLGRLVACLALILLLRRLPAVLALKSFIPEIHTWSEAIFAGHFGPMGVGAMFLSIEARARLETGTSVPSPHTPDHGKHDSAIQVVWPIVSFIVLGSIFVHGFSAVVMSIFGHFARHPKERAPLLGGEVERLYGMANENGGFSDDDTSVLDE